MPWQLKFVADGMLGKLTRWLRMLGHDVKYSNNIDDNQLLEIAKSESRVLLTRDLELYQQAATKGVTAFYLEGKTEAEKLAQVAQRFNLKLEIDMTRSRCPKCNAKIKLVSKEEVAGKVEKNTFNYYNEFWECPKCGKIYWQGSHWRGIKKTLKAAKEILERNRN